MRTNSISKEEAIKKYGKCEPGSKHIFINFEDIKKKQGIYDVEISELIFDASSDKTLSSDFTFLKTSKNFYPKPHFFRTIAELTGIRGVGSVRIEKEKDVVDINPLLAKPIEAPPVERKMHIATIAYSKAEIQCNDGTWRTSPECTGEYNFWQKAIKTWDNDEKYSNKEYTKSIDRRTYYNMLVEHSTSIAQTKSFNACVCFLVGIPKGFTFEDLQKSKGVFVFQKIIESPVYQAKIMDARIQGIKNGNTNQLKQISSEVFGDENINSDIVNGIDDNEPTETKNMRNANETPPPPPPENKKPNPFADFSKTVNNPQGTREEHIKTLREYLRNDVLKKTEGAISSIAQVLNNLDSHTDQDLKNLIDTCTGVIEKAKGEELF
jgi:hypothetical protein